MQINAVESIGGDGPLCVSCARADISGWMADLDRDDLAKLRRRAEDCLRKNPQQLRETIVAMVIAGAIEYEDVL